MDVYEKLLRPIKEVNYLRAENVERYRTIIRFFFLEYEKIHYSLHKEDVFEMMHQIDLFKDYTMEQCQLDLNSLVEWGNLIANQDSTKVRTVADFKNKRYRYQLSEYTVEIERMTLRIEKLEVEGASLEPTLIERIYQELRRFDEVKGQSDMDKHGWIQMLTTDFIHLNQNYQEYFRTLNSAKAEELMKTTQFLLFKDKLINYLRTFVMNMQEKGGLIVTYLREIEESEIIAVLQAAARYEMSIPRLDVELDEAQVYDNFIGKWQSFYRWFIGDGRMSEMDYLYDITNEIIRKMTRYAQQIAEQTSRGSNRKEQYLHLVQIFGKCQDINEAHCLSAHVFGIDHCLHLEGIETRESDDFHRGVYEEEATMLRFDPHSKMVRKKNVRQPAKDYRFEKMQMKLAQQERMDQERRRIESLIVANEIDFASLPPIDASTRKTLLNWLSKALGQSNLTAKTDEGREYYVEKPKTGMTCRLQCEDGVFEMPAFKMVFKENETWSK